MSTRSLFTTTNFCAENSILEEFSCIQKSKQGTQRLFDLGIVSECEDKSKLGKFAYHLVHLDESGNPLREIQSDRDLCYWVKDEGELLARIRELSEQHQNERVELVNDIPREVWLG